MKNKQDVILTFYVITLLYIFHFHRFKLFISYFSH